MSQNNLEKEVKKYLRSIKNALPATCRKRAALMEHFSKGVQEYCLENKENPNLRPDRYSSRTDYLFNLWKNSRILKFNVLLLKKV